MSEATLSVDEADGGGENKNTYTVALDSQPTGPVTVNLALSPATGTIMVDNTALTFQPRSWDTAQTVTVTAVDDHIDNPGDQRTATIRHAVSGADYGLVSADSVSITVEDDDDAPTGITLSASPDTITEKGGDQTVTITASTNGGAYATTTTVTVEVGKSGDTAVAGSDYTEVDDQTITISAGATSGSVDFTLTPTDDSLDEADESISVTGSVTRDSGIAVTGTAIAITDDDAEPTVSVADAAPVTEGHDLTTTDMSFEVTLSEASGKNITAPYTIESGSTATVGEDYTDPATKSVSIAAGQTSGNIVIEVKGDRVDEDNETIAIKLGDPTNAALSTTTDASGIITDDDTRGVTVSEATLSVDEADGGSTENKTTYTVALDSQPTGPVTVNLALSPATGTIMVDNTVLTFQPRSWDTAQTVTVTAVDDHIDNPGDQRTASIAHAVSGADYGSVSADSVSITVEDDDSAPGGITLSASPDTVTENGGDQTVTITASTNGGAYATTTTITVEVGKAGDTAAEGADYTEVDDQTVTISAGATSGNVDFTLTPTDDALDEADESISVSGSVTRDSSITVTGDSVAITDDDAEPTLSVADAAPVTEGHDLTTTDMSFEVTLSEASGKNITAPYTIESATTATVGEDYTDPATKSVSIAAGQTSGNIVIEVKGDRVDEDNETIAIKLGDPTNAALSTTTADITATGTITDDDTRGVTVSEATLSVDEADRGATENKTTYTVVLDSQPTGPVTVSLTLSPATGTITVDNTTLTFKPSAWNTAQTVTITAVDDAIDNPGDQRSATIRHAVSGADYGSVSADSVAITVEDDDSAPGGITLSASPDTVTENGGDQTVTITASTNGGAYATTTTVTIEVGKSGDTAAEGADYTEVDDQTITIAAGATSGSAQFTLTPTNDALDEADESISISGSVTRDSSITVTGGQRRHHRRRPRTHGLSSGRSDGNRGTRPGHDGRYDLYGEPVRRERQRRKRALHHRERIHRHGRRGLHRPGHQVGKYRGGADFREHRHKGQG